MRQREIEGSIRTLDTLLKLEPKNKEALLMRVQTYSLQGSYYYAKTLAEEMLTQFPDYAPIRLEFLRIQFAQQQWSEVQTLLTQLRNIGPFSSEEKLIEEIEVDSALNLKLNDQEFCDPYEGKCLIISNVVGIVLQSKTV